ncbi:MAG: hypothetical protein ABGX87_14150 [Alcanivorax sp.]|uniref:Uncharacterized protein n=1 Tax=Alloalcanivorax marinus TaxID=1177169 RepID=A0A9Q3UPC8_9GAMM|nr:hypothetical protein [Alloalcanivorax marinus]MBM7333921.1 hypothetical protein [Alloalcanivorax marinus]MCC4309019.1 hypothetical protein [Alloalcanivorax marinus]
MNDDNRFHVVVTGETLGGADPEQVAARLARLFKMPDGKARQLLGGGPRTVKRDADEATARKFQVALRQAGARCELRPVGASARGVSEEASASGSGAGQAATEAAKDTLARGAEGADLETVGTLRTGGTGFTGPFQVAPVGADMDPSERPAPPPAPDTGHLSMAEPGAVIETLKREAPAAVPDTGHLSLVEEERG